MREAVKKCRNCKAEFEPRFNSTQVACSTPCAIELARKKVKKQYRAQTTKLRKEFLDNDKTHWKQKAARACHEYIRARDGSHCISCGEDRPGNQIHAGHMRTRAAASQLQFHWANINSQCSRCNLNLSGNLLEYRRHLVDKVGLELVEYLENENSVYVWTVDDYKEVTEHFKGQLASLADKQIIK